MSVLCFLCGRHGFLSFWWHKKQGINLCRRCWPNLPSSIDWFEKRYATLCDSIGNILIHKAKLFKLLGLKQSHVKIDDGKWLTERVIEHLNLPKGDIQFEFKKMEGSIAGTVKNTGSGYLVEMSQDLQENFRALSAILIHELMHIYLGEHNLLYKSKDEYEELTDLSCILLGFGIPMINAKRAWHVNKRTLVDSHIAGETSYHIIGYLSEEQIGYAFGYFIANNNIHMESVETDIDSQCWHIVLEGIGLEKKYHNTVLSKRKTKQFLSEQDVRKKTHEFSCPACCLKMAVPGDTIDRIGVFKINCHKCGSEIHFDGKKIVKFIESIK